jgi:hypothetical protein
MQIEQSGMMGAQFSKVLGSRAVVFGLAWLSFGCLLGQFYGLWTMHFFGCWVLPPATVLLAVAAYLHRGEPVGVGSPWIWVVQGGRWGDSRGGGV